MFRLTVLLLFLGAFALAGCSNAPEEKKDTVKSIRNMGDLKGKDKAPPKAE